jgi:D-psicose/D-tagatose/L-ribulose 3-epimerase
MGPTLSLSNIAWPPDAQDEAIATLKSLDVTAIEIAPFNVFHTWDVGLDRVRDLRLRLDDVGIACPAMQGIVFNVTGAHLFRSAESRLLLHAHLVTIARVAGVLGARACVFGAPKLRDPGDLQPEEAFDKAAEFLRWIGPAFANEGSVLAFEPNATAYACRFVTTTAEAIDLVSYVATPGIGLQIDTGTVFLEAEDPAILTRAVPYAAHAHISEPALAPIGTSGVDHRPLARSLKAGGYEGSISIEMKSTHAWREAIHKAVALTREVYLT